MENATAAAEERSVSESIFELEQGYVVPTYARSPIVVHRGKGCYVFDSSGKRYLDFVTGIGVNALGHAHPRILKALKEQAGLLIHCSNLYYNEYQGPLAKKLAEISGLQRTFFSNSGTEAMEAGLKMIRAYGSKISPEKYEIISLENSFHGRTLGSLSVTGQPKYRNDFQPLLPGVQFVPPNDAEALEEVVTERTAGILMEGIQGEGGVRPMDEGYIRRAGELAAKYDALLLFDEIQCGVGRTGKHFSYQSFHHSVMPDIVTAAKPLACGLPLGVTIASEKAAAAIGRGMHGSTFGGGALPCRVALEFLEILDELLPSIFQHGGYFRMRLEELARHFHFVKEVRVHGLMIGLELKIPGKALVEEAMHHGLLINCTNETVLRFLPPYIIDEPTIDKGVGILEKVLRKGREIYLETHAADELAGKRE
jgi:predicted acetylornithine/succinylornithine family transaminase